MTNSKRQEAKSRRATVIIERLRQEFPNATTELAFTTPLELLIATMLSAQCTDKRVNLVTKELFTKYRGAKDYAESSLDELETAIKSTGFYKNKAKNIKACCSNLVQAYQGQVPATLQELVDLPGVGRKTANCVLGGAFGIPALVVDTHVGRIANRLGLTTEQDPVKIEFDLQPLIPQRWWIQFSNMLILHGRKTCTARNPKCQHCSLLDLCPTGKSSNQPEMEESSETDNDNGPAT